MGTEQCLMTMHMTNNMYSIYIFVYALLNEFD